MPGLTIGWEYLTGYYRAMDSTSRRRCEWPSHPGRVFMALAAAWFETAEDTSEGNALRWLEKLGDPQLVLPPNGEVSHREVVTVFVPVNGDQAKDTFPEKKSLPLQSAPAIVRKKNDRTFPSVWVGDALCFLHWPNAMAADVDTHQLALDRLCGKVTRIGHSSSLVRMWLAKEVCSLHALETWEPDNGLSEFQVRRVSEGTLNLLNRQFNRQGREEHARLLNEFTRIEAEKPKGAGAKELKTEIKAELERLDGLLKSVDARAPIRPKLGLWSGYRRRDTESSAHARHTDFDSDLLILMRIDGPGLPLVSTLSVTQALRGTVLRYVHLQNCGCDRWENRRPTSIEAPECYAKIPAWVSGHSDNNQPLRDGRQHLAFTAIPFVGSEHADGHLLGAAIVFPREVSRPDRGRALGRFLLESSGQSRKVTLALGSLGVWTLIKRDWSDSRQALRPETWTAHPEGATTWATVTPVVLDRFPKSDPIEERTARQIEVVGIIATTCERLGLPTPVDIDFGTTSWHQGSSRASTKRRRLRGHANSIEQTTSLGDGFLIYPTKGSSGPKPQLHVYLRFAEPIVGPILLGAGRFMGYGLCKPLWGGYGR